MLFIDVILHFHELKVHVRCYLMDLPRNGSHQLIDRLWMLVEYGFEIFPFDS